MADIDSSGRDEKTRRMYRRMPWFYGVVAACLLITAIAGFSQAGTNRPLRYYTDDGSTAMTYYTNGSGNNTSFWGINTDNPRCEFDINGTICINGSSHLVQGVAINGTLISADGNNYPTALSVNQTGSSYSVVLGRFGLGSLMGNFTVSSSNVSGGIGYVNTTGANFNSTNWFIRMINDTTAQAAGVSCNAGDAISTLSNNSVCTSFITPAALSAFGYISSAPNVNVTNFTGSGSVLSLYQSNGTIYNVTIPTGTGSGNITGSGIANYVARFTNGTNIATGSIYDNGNVSIGTQNPDALLSINQTADDQALYIRSNATTLQQDAVRIHTTSGARSLFIDQDGDAGSLIIDSRANSTTALAVSGYNTQLSTVKIESWANTTSGAALGMFLYGASGNAHGITIQQAGDGYGLWIQSNSSNYPAILSDNNKYGFKSSTNIAGGYAGYFLTTSNVSASASNGVVKIETQNTSDTSPTLMLTNAGVGNTIEGTNFNVSYTGNGKFRNFSFTTADNAAEILFPNTAGKIRYSSSSPYRGIFYEAPGLSGGWYGAHDFYTGYNGGASSLTMRISNSTVGINTSDPNSTFHVVGDSNVTGTTFTSVLFVNNTQVCLQNGTNCPAGGAGNVTASNGTAGFVGVFSSASNLVAMLINSTMVGDAAVNATHLYTSNGGSAGQVLTLNSTGGMNWSTPSTGSSSGSNASYIGDGTTRSVAMVYNNTDYNSTPSVNITSNGTIKITDAIFDNTVSFANQTQAQCAINYTMGLSQSQSTWATPVDSVTACLPVIQGTIINATSCNSSSGIPIPFDGYVRRVFIIVQTNGTLSSNQNTSYQVWINGINTGLDGNLTMVTRQNATNITNINTQVAFGDYIGVRATYPAWTTNPTQLYQKIGVEISKC